MPRNPVIRSFFARNGLTIVIVAAIAIFIILGIQCLNSLAKESKENINLNTNVAETKIIMPTEVVQKFLKYCNSKDVSSAMALLTLECKEKEEDFNNWLEKYFNYSRTYSIEKENFDGGKTIYTITIMDNILEAGSVNSNLQEIIIKVILENGNYKIEF